MKKSLLANLLCLIYFGALASEKVPSSASRNDWALTSPCGPGRASLHGHLVRNRQVPQLVSKEVYGGSPG